MVFCVLKGRGVTLEKVNVVIELYLGFVRNWLRGLMEIECNGMFIEVPMFVLCCICMCVYICMCIYVFNCVNNVYVMF